MTVYFIGAGPGDPDLLTIKAQRTLLRCPVCLYAGSLVPTGVLACVPPTARIIDTAPLTLDTIINEIVHAHAAGHDVARVHSGDPSLYGAVHEQIVRLRALGIPYQIIPGVPAYTAAAAKMGDELTRPALAQSVVLTRMGGKATAMPEAETLERFACTGAVLILHLSIRFVRRIKRTLLPYYGNACPVVVSYRVGWPDEMMLYSTLESVDTDVRAAKITRTALIFVGQTLPSAPPDAMHSQIDEHTSVDSALYDPAHAHILRPHRTPINRF